MDKADLAVKLHRAAFNVSRIWVLPWILLLANVSLGVWTLRLVLYRGTGLSESPGPSLLVPAVALVDCLLLGLIWLSSLSWYGPWSRAVIWWMAQKREHAYQWLKERSVLLPFLLVACTLLAGAILVLPVDESWKESAGSVLNLTLAVMLAAVFYALYKARKRVVILPFKIYKGQGPKKKEEEKEETTQGEALASRLRSEIAAIVSVYQIIDEVSPTKQDIEATVSVEDAGKDLRDVLGPDSKLKLWSMEIPIGTLIGLFGWLSKGPQLTGALHQEEGELLLVASLSGSGAPMSWRVSSKDLAGEEGWMDLRAPGWREPACGDLTAGFSAQVSGVVRELIRLLAYRIVAHLVNTGSPRWQAVYHYTEGLRAYRATLLTNHEKEVNLHQAERAFVRALGCDRQFAQCHYNLGIVYRDVQKPKAAAAAFRRALQENPGSVDAAYAIALSLFDERRYPEAVLACDHAIRIRPGDARAWKLKGFAWRRQLEGELGTVPLPASHPEWRRILRDREIGAALAWRSLCRAPGGTGFGEQQRWTAAAATLNSGIAQCLMGRWIRGRRRLWQSVHLSPNAPVLRLEIGKTWYQAGQWRRARKVLEPLTAEALPVTDQPSLLLYRLYAPLGRRQGIEEEIKDRWKEYRQMLDLIAVLRRQDREYLDEDIKTVKNFQPQEAGRLQWILDFLDGLGRQSGESGEAHLRRLQELKPSPGDLASGHWLDEEGRDWLRAQVEVRLAEECLRIIDEDGEEGRRELLADRARDRLEKALKTLGGEQCHQIKAQGLRSQLARALLILAESRPEERSAWLTEALRQADAAVNEAPEGAEQRLALGRVYAALHDYVQAEDELTASLQFECRSSTSRELAEACSNRGATLQSARNRESDLFIALRALDNALIATELQSLTGQDTPDPIREHGRIHARLGKLYGASVKARPSTLSAGPAGSLGEGEASCDHAIYHQRIAVAMGYKPVESRIDLGWTYLEAKDYARAETLFLEALEEIGRGQGSTDPDRARILLGRALVRAERGLGLEEAEQLARNASEHIDGAGGLRQRELRSLYHQCIGLIRFQAAHRLSRRGDPQFREGIDDALQELERAIALDTSATAYARLALVYLEKAEGQEGDRDWWLERAREACKLAEQEDRSGGCGKEIARIQERLSVPAVSIPSREKDLANGITGLALLMSSPDSVH